MSDQCQCASKVISPFSQAPGWLRLLYLQNFSTIHIRLHISCASTFFEYENVDNLGNKQPHSGGMAPWRLPHRCHCWVKGCGWPKETSAPTSAKFCHFGSTFTFCHPVNEMDARNLWVGLSIPKIRINPWTIFPSCTAAVSAIKVRVLCPYASP